MCFPASTHVDALSWVDNGGYPAIQQFANSMGAKHIIFGWCYAARKQYVRGMFLHLAPGATPEATRAAGHCTDAILPRTIALFN